MIDSEQFPVVWLKTIFRQALQSQIVVNAHAINRGELPSLKPEKDSSDFYFLEESDSERAAALIVSLVKDRLPKRYALDPMRDIQVLTPMHKGVLGASHLNQALREALNPSENRLSHGHSSYAAGDKLMQIRNDYDKDVYNGDMGLVTEVNPEETSLVVAFEGKSVLYTGQEIDDLLLAYAISIHKSQGCEYPVVVIALSTEHAILLQRNLLYTALTRGKKLVVLVGSAKAIGMAVRNDRPSRRYSRLKTRIQAHGKGSNSQYRLCQDDSQRGDSPPPDRLSPSRERP
jgi:exodeoxyribonuclease V alpha subunit